MTVKKFLLIGFFICLPLAHAQEPTQKLTNLPDREEAFMDWGLGMFVHWSLDSQLGSVISHSLVGASEDYIQRYLSELPQSFSPDNYDPDQWMRIAKRTGVKYMVFTAKHHSGFCMWDTETTDFSIMNTSYGQDIVERYVDACREYGLKVGFYFSPEDFYFLHQQGHLIRRRADYAQPTHNTELLEYDKQQVNELLTNYGDIDVLFFDGIESEPLVQYAHQLQPECIVTRGEMQTPEQEIPGRPMPGPWEACFTLGTQWHFKPTNEDYKSGTTLINMLIEIRAKGGNLLINAGPQPNGMIPFEQTRRFRELGLWMFVNRDAIYDIRPCPVIREGNLWFTRDTSSNTAFVFLTNQGDWPLGERREFVLQSISATPETEISVLGQNDKVVEYHPEKTPVSRYTQQDDLLLISVVRAQRLYNNRQWPNPVVVKLTNVEFNEK